MDDSSSAPNLALHYPLSTPHSWPRWFGPRKLCTTFLILLLRSRFTVISFRSHFVMVSRGEMWHSFNEVTLFIFFSLCTQIRRGDFSFSLSLWSFLADLAKVFIRLCLKKKSIVEMLKKTTNHCFSCCTVELVRNICVKLFWIGDGLCVFVTR